MVSLRNKITTKCFATIILWIIYGGGWSENESGDVRRQSSGGGGYGGH